MIVIASGGERQFRRVGYIRAMDSTELSSEQLEALASRLRPILRAANELQALGDRELAPGDTLLEKLREAADRAAALWVFTHYRSCNVGAAPTRHG